ncbi:C-_U-editing enzyme APOBEC-2a [Brachyhypopomus gauderio]|uniref:C->U-editing enzyme APOBEC-2a n=1 Tax=Brachyhypopomus gauderio TaxID=698409 RepID=UPI0040426805
MADKSTNSRLAGRRKERAMEKKTEVEEKKEEKKGAVREDETKASVNGAGEAVANGAGEAITNGDAATNREATNTEGDQDKPEPMELPPFETITGDRIDPFFFKFQFKNVEYSSGRNKTFLCYLVDQGGSEDGVLRGYVEDEHAGSHAEDMFFQLILPHYDPSVKYSVTWYVSSSPCASCAAKLVEILRERKSMRFTLFSARLFEWEEPEIREGLKALAGAGCKLRVMKPLDFSYTWDTFVEHDDQRFTPWEDCQENYEYYQEKLADILQ